MAAFPIGDDNKQSLDFTQGCNRGTKAIMRSIRKPHLRSLKRYCHRPSSEIGRSELR